MVLLLSLSLLFGLKWHAYLSAMFLYDRKEDAGLLVYKDHLPVSKVVVGDTSRAGSEGKLTVGPLKCQGDSKSSTYVFSQSRFTAD